MASSDRDTDRGPDAGAGRGRIVDAHVHLWDQHELDYAWLADVDGLDGRYLPADLRAAAGALDADLDVVVVQGECRPDQALDEVRWIASGAAADPMIAGVVAFAPLEDPAAAASALDELASFPIVRGIRRNIQFQPSGFAASLIAGVRLVAERGWPSDLCVTADQLAELPALIEAVPGGRFVLDHLGKPRPGVTDLDRWRSDLRRVAESGEVWCKLSGLMTEVPPGAGPEVVDELLRVAIETFGPTRVMFGSDWPVCTLASTYEAWHDAVVAAAGDVPPADLFAGNAIEFYGLA